MRKAIDWAQVKARLAKTQSAIEQSLRPDGRRLAAIFAQRAERFARRRDIAENASAGFHVLAFRIGSERLAIEISEIAEVLPMPKITLVPSAPQSLFGVFNLRGEIVPIIELAAVLGLAPAAGTAAGYVLMLRHHRGEVGLKIGETSGIEHIPPEDASPAAEIASERAKHFFKGIAKDNTLILDMDAIRKTDVFQGE